MEDVVELLLEPVVDAVDLGPDFVKLKAAAEDLNPQVILLIDHDGDGFILAQGDAAAAARVGVLSADEVSLNQHLLIDLVGLGDLDVIPFAAGRHRVHVTTNERGNLALLLVPGLSQEGVSGDVPRQPNSGADHDVRHRSAAAEPFAGMTCQIVDDHDSSMTRISSRRRAARSNCSSLTARFNSLRSRIRSVSQARGVASRRGTLPMW